ncbi:hypothetical protein D3C86_759190 [compost metagenome]
MTVVALHPERVEVWSGTIAGDVSPTWFVSHVCSEGEAIVADRCSEDEALSDARDWQMPIVRRR